MNITTHKKVIDILNDSSLDYKATVIELAKSYPSTFLKCYVTPAKVVILTREQEEKRLVAKHLPNNIIMAIKELRDYRRDKNLEPELCGLYICKTDCERYRGEYNEEKARES